MAVKNTHQKLVSENAPINTSVLYKTAIKTSGEVLKGKNSEVKLCHVSDREFDCVDYFEYIVSLGDNFIIRSKLSRNSHHTQQKLTKKGNVSKTMEILIVPFVLHFHSIIKPCSYIQCYL